MDPAIVTFLAAGTLGAGVSAALRLWELRSAPALDRAWSEAARRVRGRVLIEPATFWSRAVRYLKFEVEGTALTIDTFTERTGKTTQRFTRLRAGPLPGLCRVDLSVTPRTVLLAITRRLALGELPTADEPFDAAFHVSALPQGLAHELLDAPTRKRTVVTGEGFEIEGKTLTVLASGFPDEAAPLVGMARYGQSIVERWVELARAPAALATALGLGPVGAMPELASEGPTTVARGTRQGRELTLSVLTEGRRCLTIVAAAVPGALPFTLDRTSASASAAVPSYARALSERAPPELVRIVGEPGRVALELEGLMQNHDRLARLVEALLEATRAGGAYR